MFVHECNVQVCEGRQVPRQVVSEGDEMGGGAGKGAESRLESGPADRSAMRASTSATASPCRPPRPPCPSSARCSSWNPTADGLNCSGAPSPLDLPSG